MKTNAQIRQSARESIRGNWNAGVIVVLLYIVLSGASTYVVPILSPIFLGYPLQFGLLTLFLALVCKGERPAPEHLFGAFCKEYYWRSVGVMLLSGLYILLWTLLLIIPGIIKSYSYRLAPYIIYDEPNLSSDAAIEKSMKMMKGHKMDLFLMDLGYYGWSLLAIIFTLGIAMLWIIPYYFTVYAKFYTEVKGEYETNNTEQ